jgi:parvulin-like peptidyl-prolyl isomerase
MAKEETPKVVTKKHQARLEREQKQNRWIIIVSVAVIVLVVVVLGYGVLDKNVLQKYQPVAKVNNDSITTEEFQRYAKFTRSQYIQQYQQYEQLMSYFGSDSSTSSYFQQTLTQIQTTLNDSVTLGNTVLTNLIQDKLIRQEAAKRGITVTNQDLDKAMQEAFGYYANGTPTAAPTSAIVPTSTLSEDQKKWIATVAPTLDLTATLAPTSAVEPTSTPLATEAATAAPTESGPTATPAPTATPYTLEGYKTVLKNYGDNQLKSAGLTESDLRKILENQLYRTKLEDAVTKDLTHDQDQVWARHILVSDKATADKIYEQLTKENANFAALAAANSIDTGTKDAGGDLGWFGSGTMVTEFETVAFKLKVGEISQPVQTKFGYHIIQVLGHETRHLDDTAFKTLKDNTFTAFVTKLQDAAKITKNDIWKERVPTTPVLDTSAAVPN